MSKSTSKSPNLDKRALATEREGVRLKRDISMRIFAYILAFSLATAAAQEPVASPPGAAEQTQFMRLEQLWNDAHLRGDAKTLDSLWAEDLIITVPKMPVMNKEQTLGVWRTGRISFKRYETSDVQIRVYSDAAVVTGRLLRARAVSGQEMQDDWRFTKVYVRKSGQWKVVTWHASESAPQ
jgi:ketosteroid isomerase-like protein